jgi:1-acyl-sn-glycerol-3-phosphate acyltransferase
MSEHPTRWGIERTRWAFAALFRRQWDIRLHHADRVPAGPVIIAGNHVGVIDGPLLAICGPRPLHALTKSEMFEGRTKGFLEWAGQIPVVRNTPDATAIRMGLSVLSDGGALGIFPEGARESGRYEKFEDGVAYFALASGAPVVPVTAFGTRLSFHGREDAPLRGARLDLVYGEPITFAAESWPRTRTHVADVSAQIREHLIAALHDAEAETGLTLQRGAA